MFFAHSVADADRARWQQLAEHLENVGVRAAACAMPFGGERAAALAGLLHDLGKYAPGFQRYINGKGPSIEHSIAGAREVMALTRGRDRIMADVLAYAIAGHHAGLPDRRGDGGGTLDERVKRDVEEPDPIWRREIAADATALIPEGLHWHSDSARRRFQLAFFGRMIFSCLVDADFLDTEDYYAKVEARPVDRGWPQFPDIVGDLVVRFDRYMANKQSVAGETPVNRLRAEVLAHVRDKSALPPGLFTLNVPTGGGKTLASLGFALDHARRHGLRRIVYGIPFAGARIETLAMRLCWRLVCVAPRAGARIETLCGHVHGNAERSLPVRERGSSPPSCTSQSAFAIFAIPIFAIRLCRGAASAAPAVRTTRAFLFRNCRPALLRVLACLEGKFAASAVASLDRGVRKQMPVVFERTGWLPRLMGTTPLERAPLAQGSTP